MTYGQFGFTILCSVLISAAVTLGVTDFMINKQIKEGVNTGPVTFTVQGDVSPEIRQKAEDNKALSEANILVRQKELDSEFSKYAGFTVVDAWKVTSHKGVTEVKEMIELGRQMCFKSNVKLLKFYETTFPLVICEDGYTN
ncbi:hypothetical protein [Salmonella phage GSW6]|uniref:Uncharacterized protein n=1 Tax=Salmonella phage GSW6 TaxID=3025422 RepID=A0AAF0BYX1_9CAUD|nr:hypothetical protein [Salmonella phage GSW6]